MTKDREQDRSHGAQVMTPLDIQPSHSPSHDSLSRLSWKEPESGLKRWGGPRGGPGVLASILNGQVESR